MVERHIVGLGGGGDIPAQMQLLYDYVLALTGKERPRLLGGGVKTESLAPR